MNKYFFNNLINIARDKSKRKKHSIPRYSKTIFTSCSHDVIFEIDFKRNGSFK